MEKDLRSEFESIRPYRDHEVAAAVHRLVEHPGFEGVLNYLYEGSDMARLREDFLKVQSVEAFQVFFSRHTVRRIVEKTSRGLSDEGAGHLDNSRPYLFVANHRDIVLDAAIMQLLLHLHQHKTTQITFGTNLMYGQLLMDLGKLNKMFTFYRGGTRTEEYRNAQINSAYINHVVKEVGESIWIAQRNGRTKDGNDRTQPGLIKMFAMGSKDICSALEALNMVPVTISYEIEPCELQKVRELYISRRQNYQKAPDEDFQSILAGITGEKGRIHYVFGSPLNQFIRDLGGQGLRDNEVVEQIVEEIDRQVHRDYKLWPSNYLAHDLLHGQERHRSKYKDEDKQVFTRRMEKQLDLLQDLDREECRELYLELYARPLDNKAHSIP